MPQVKLLLKLFDGYVNGDACGHADHGRVNDHVYECVRVQHRM